MRQNDGCISSSKNDWYARSTHRMEIFVCSLLVAGQKDGVVSVPAEGAVATGVRSVVHMVRAGVTRWGSVRIAGGGEGQGKAASRGFPRRSCTLETTQKKENFTTFFYQT